MFGEAPHGWHANMQALLSVQVCTQRCKCGIGLLLHELAHMGQGSLIPQRPPAARMGAWADVPSGPAPSEELLDT